MRSLIQAQAALNSFMVAVPAGNRDHASGAWPSLVFNFSKVTLISSPACIRRASRTACGLVACAASPMSSVRLRDHIGNVATLRFATEGYQSMPAATEELEAMVEAAPKGKVACARKPARKP
jgi:hypothetical protein